MRKAQGAWRHNHSLRKGPVRWANAIPYAQEAMGMLCNSFKRRLDDQVLLTAERSTSQLRLSRKQPCTVPCACQPQLPPK